MAQWVKNLPAVQECRWWGFHPQVRKIPWKRAMHSSILAWRIPWTGEPGGLSSTGSPRITHKWLSTHARIDQANASVGLIITIPLLRVTLCLFLKQHKFIILQFGRLEVRHRSQRTKIKVSAEWHSCLEALRESSFPYFSSSHSCPLNNSFFSSTFKASDAASLMVFPLSLFSCLPHSKRWWHWTHSDNPG